MYILVDRFTREPLLKKDDSLFEYSTSWTARLGRRWITSQEGWTQKLDIVEVGV